MLGVIPILNRAISKSRFSPLSSCTDFAILFSEIILFTPELSFNISPCFSMLS